MKRLTVWHQKQKHKATITQCFAELINIDEVYCNESRIQFIEPYL